jgi:hypothetical protein
MSLKKIKRAEKKGTESVMDEKFALLFWSEFSIGSGEFSFQVRGETEIGRDEIEGRERAEKSWQKVIPRPLADYSVVGQRQKGNFHFYTIIIKVKRQCFYTVGRAVIAGFLHVYSEHNVFEMTIYFSF